MSAAKAYNLSGRNLFYHLLKNNNYFRLGLVIKLLLSIFFASAYMSDLFAPFIKEAVNGNFFDVYKDVYPVKPNAFPYPPVMLYLLAVPRYIASIFFSASGPVSFIDLLCLRLPLLFADVVILVGLIKWVRNVKQVIKWYWFNPVIIYISYIHGQLDIIPTALLCLALYFLFTDKLKHFVVFLALACATKFHIIITFPLIMIYLYKTKKLNTGELIKNLLLFIAIITALNLPFLFQPEFIKMVYKNKEQTKVLSSFFTLFDDYKLIFIPAGYMMLLYIMMDFRFINKDILLIFLALSFGIITFFIVPGQGWYIWNMPFFIYFLVRFNFKAKWLFVMLNLSYFIFFIIFPQSDFPLVAQFIWSDAKTSSNLYHFLEQHNIDANSILQIAFTLLQVTLLLFCISLFRQGVWQIKKHKIYQHPYLIGICGDSGTGKSTLSKNIVQLFGHQNMLVIHGDDMHRWERGHEKWNEFTHLNPKANWLHRDLANLIDLKDGKKIMRRLYDHDTGKFTNMMAVKPGKVIVYEGLHSFYLREASNIYDLKIFMKPSEELRRFWKVERDVKIRGYEREKVLEAIEKRLPDSASHILSQETEADIIFSIEEDVANISAGNQDEKQLCLKITCTNDVYFEHLVDHLTKSSQLRISHDIDRNSQQIIICGIISKQKIEEAAEALQIDIEDLIGSMPSWRNGLGGIMQLFVAYTMLNQFKRTGMLVSAETYN